MISVVIPAYNEEKYIGNLLAAILAQESSEEIEIVVADAESVDSTNSIVLEYQKKSPLIKLVAGGTPAVGRNNGGKTSSGDPIFFIDADMEILDAQFFEKGAKFFRERKLGIATIYLKPDSSYWVDHVLVALYNFWLPISRFTRPSGSMCIVASREIFQKTGGYPEDVIMCEDHDFVYKASKISRYGIIPLYLKFSMRRYNKEGRPRVLFKYFISSLYLIFVGPIKHPLFSYEFGNFRDEHKTSKTKTS